MAALGCIMNTAYYILTTSDSEDLEGKKVAALTLFKERQQSNQWNLYARTPHRTNIKAGDYCLFYLAGDQTNRQHIVGEGVVREIYPVKKYQAGKYNSEPPVSTIEFDDLIIYQVPVSVKDHLDRLSFIPRNKSKWGAAIQSGCKKISFADFCTLRRNQLTSSSE
jgi:hypothetical protein